MYNYCTLFDKNYLIRGLAMYESLKTYSKDFHLYIFAFDDLTAKILKEMNLSYVTIISLNEFEDEELLALKPTRTKVEYFWTCTPSVIKYCIETFNLPSCTYIDADIYFYHDPAVLLEEMGDNSVLITPHWYTPMYDQSAISGIYCVQFVTFKNTPEGMEVLEWWRKSCNAWCYARFEDGKFGDQKYLDNWPEKFKGVYVLKNRGGGVAPWNVQQYDLVNHSTPMLRDKKTMKLFPVIFYHYHNLRFLTSGKVYLGPYYLPSWVIKNFYIPYILHLLKLNGELEKKGYKEDFYGTAVLPKDLEFIKTFARLNIFSSFFFYLFNKLPEQFWNISNGVVIKKLQYVTMLLVASNNIIKFSQEE